MSTTSDNQSNYPADAMGVKPLSEETKPLEPTTQSNSVQAASDNSILQRSDLEQKAQPSQEILYQFLLEIVKKWPPEEVLLEFKRLFFCQVGSTSSHTVQAVYELVLKNDETEFRNTLKRCCYILINNWDAARHYRSVQDLVQLFKVSTLQQQTISPTLRRLKDWVTNFSQSQDYEDLKLFASRYDEQQNTQKRWTNRYVSYLLVPQFVDPENPIEQREAARALAKRLKERFKFDLAMYIVKSQTARGPEKVPKNPTELGENALLLIKTIVAKRGRFSYANLANIFLKQTQHLSYQGFKKSLQKYLIFSTEKSAFAEVLQSRLSEKLNALYSDYDEELINDALILRTCNRIIDYLTTENKQDPSSLFILLLSPGNPMTLVILLLKLILVCRNSRTHLEARVAELIRYYADYPEEECRWIVNFLEIFNVTFTIYAENVHYNLVKMDESTPAIQADVALDDYRIFAQTKSTPASENSIESSVLEGDNERE